MKKKPINMATGGLMSMPPYIKANDKSDDGITPYDVSTPESARKGLPQRVLSKDRTRFNKGGSLYSEGKKAKYALGGYMDNFQISQEEPLSRGKYNIGGQAALEEKYDRRKDYKAFAEGDLVEEEMIEEPLMAPAEMQEPLIADEIADDEMVEEDAIAEDEEMMDADVILDTSALSEEEEIVLDEAVEMHPELESIIPKIVATEFTEDELVEGPGTGTSDSIPAMLSDGEFVFTAKAVKNIGVDKLRKMMAQAEESYDAGQIAQEEDAVQAEADSLLV